MNSKPKVCVVYAVNDAPHYRKMMDLSIRSWKRFHPEWSLEVITLPSANTVLDSTRWRLGSTAQGIAELALQTLAGKKAKAVRNTTFAEKLDVFLKLNYDRTLFLDCDTYVMRPLDDLAASLDNGYDVVVQKNEGLTYEPQKQLGTSSFPVINSGVFFASPIFSKTMIEYAAKCTTSLSELWESDQYLLSYCLHDAAHLKINYADNLQLSNSELDFSHYGIAADDKIPKSVHDHPAHFAVFHYIFHKRDVFNMLAKYDQQVVTV